MTNTTLVKLIAENFKVHFSYSNLTYHGCIPNHVKKLILIKHFIIENYIVMPCLSFFLNLVCNKAFHGIMFDCTRILKIKYYFFLNL
jgi:hypothetical protein